jgi:hypothetical protein
MPTARFTPKVVRANRRFAGDRDQRTAHHGWFMSHKDGTAIPCKGLLAHPFLELVHMRPEVVRVEAKAPILQWYASGDWELYRARYGLVLKGREGYADKMVEVELLNDLELVRDAWKWKRIRQAYRDEHRSFAIFTNHKVLAEPRLTNAMIVNSQAGEGLVSFKDKDAILSATQDSVTFSINELVEKGVLDYAQAYGAVLNLVAAGVFKFNTGRKFDGDTPVFRRVSN